MHEKVFVFIKTDILYYRFLVPNVCTHRLIWHVHENISYTAYPSYTYETCQKAISSSNIKTLKVDEVT